MNDKLNRLLEITRKHGWTNLCPHSCEVCKEVDDLIKYFDELEETITRLREH